MQCIGTLLYSKLYCILWLFFNTYTPQVPLGTVHKNSFAIILFIACNPCCNIFIDWGIYGDAVSLKLESRLPCCQ